ncbi:MAG: HIT family protein [Elusimicrobia bacterium]|nr:HIT family protein [Elusimicrobiota bacterium]
MEKKPAGRVCAFCSIEPAQFFASNDLAVAIRDRYPISPGHLLIIPRRHVPAFMDTTAAERTALWALVPEELERLTKEHSPDGFNIGLNDGPAAGQTIGHLHLHVIPRYKGDAPDPRGGVRWILPAKAKYWAD